MVPMKLKQILLAPNGGDILRGMHQRGELAEFLPALAELDIEDARSHRHKNNFYHSVVVYEQAKELGNADDLILLTAALLHDIGKKATRAFDAKGNPTFTSHEYVGAKMIRKVLKAHDYSNDELKLIEELVKNHMRSFGFRVEKWTDSAVRRLAADVPDEKQIQRLLILFRADVTTKNETFKKNIDQNMRGLAARIAEVKNADKLKARRPAVSGDDLMEVFGMTPGKELGSYMKYLNSEEGLTLSRDEALAWVADAVKRANL
jgi:poly(A) polymerase